MTEPVNQEPSIYEPGFWVIVTQHPFLEGTIGRVLYNDRDAFMIMIEAEADTLSEAQQRLLSPRHSVHFSVPAYNLIPYDGAEREAKIKTRKAQRELLAKMKANFTDNRVLRSTRRAFEYSRDWDKTVKQVLHTGWSPSYEGLICSLFSEMNDAGATDAIDRIKSELGISVSKCSDCGAYEFDDHVEYTTDGEAICGTCIQNEYVWSDCMDGYIKSSRAYDVYTTIRAWDRGDCDDHCTRDYGDDAFMFHEGDYFESHVYEYVTVEPDYSDDDDDNDENEDGLRSYHSTYRNFIEVNSTPAIPALGVELEVYAEDRWSAVRAVKKIAPDWYLERDGSLHDDYGFEIISQPYGPTEWPERANDVLSALMDAGALGYSHPDSNMYGIHVNVRRSRLSAMQEARLLMFLTDSKNEFFVRAIAQRQSVYGNGFDIGCFKQPKVSSVGGLNRYNKSVNGLGKYSPLNLHDGLAEFRLFQSTLYYPSFMKNLEFVWALIEWTDVRSATGTSVNHLDFVKWLGETPSRERQYPHLLAFLRRSSYMGKKYVERIYNTWAHLLPKQTTKSLDVVSGEPDLRLAA